MKGRLIKIDRDKYQFLCMDGTIIRADKKTMYDIFIGFKVIDNISGKMYDDNKQFIGYSQEYIGDWDKEYPEMSSYPAVSTAAYITDNFQLVIDDYIPLKTLFEQQEVHVTKMLTVKEFAELHGKSIERIKVLCRNGQIKCQKVGRDWLIEKSQQYPIDGRVKTRKYM